MNSSFTTFALYALGAGALTTSLVKLKGRVALLKGKHRSLSGHSRMARRIAAMVPYYEYGDERFFRVDGAPAEVAARREAGFRRLSRLYAERYPETMRLTHAVKDSISDLQFTDAYRVPFQFSRFVRTHLPAPAFIQASSGVTITDLDGNSFYDLTGSYGVNLFGYDFYKQCIERGTELVRELGPVLGPYHPVTTSSAFARFRRLTKSLSTCREPKP